MNFKHFRSANLAVILTATFLSSHAQQVQGTVQDPSGALIPDAEITLLQGNHVTAHTLTGSDGRFALSSQDKGTYLLRVEAPDLRFFPNRSM